MKKHILAACVKCSPRSIYFNLNPLKNNYDTYGSGSAKQATILPSIADKLPTVPCRSSGDPSKNEIRPLTASVNACVTGPASMPPKALFNAINNCFTP